MLGEEISTEGPIHINSSVLLNCHVSQRTVKLEVTIE